MEETELKVHLSETQRLVEQVNKRVIGRVVETRQVAPRKRVKLIVQGPLPEPNFERVFDDLFRIIKTNHLDQFLICDVCRDVKYGAATKKIWASCAHCACDICPSCLPEHQSDTVDQVHVFYCSDCSGAINNTPDTEDGYQELMVQFDCYHR